MCEEYSLIMFYTIKRLFLFADEWLCYVFALIMLIKGHYKTSVFIFMLGFAVLHVSYHNLDLIEKEIVNIDQVVSPFNLVFDYVVEMTNFV